MRYAIGKNKKTNKTELIDAQELEKNPAMAEQYIEFRCPECGAQAFLCRSSGKHWYYGCRPHHNGCGLALEARAKPVPVVIDYVVDFDAMLSKNDPTIENRNGETNLQGEVDTESIDFEEKTEEDYIEHPIARRVASIGSMRRGLRCCGRGDDFSGRTAESYVMTPERRMRILQGEIDGFFAVSGVRTGPQKVGPKFAFPRGYALLAEINSAGAQVYFLIKLYNPANNRRFRDLLMGSPERGVEPSRRKYINVFAAWRVFENPDIPAGKIVLIAEVNCHCVEFANDPIKLREEDSYEP